ncbi:MAG: hypothetical protein NE328_19145 [Lentisphaeraceae bacterium]|nr:hypothetical protein [Lentisphaeraceae bacterium]
MLTIKHTPKKKQPELFPVLYQGRMKSLGEVRNRVGDRVEDLVRTVLGLTKISIDGNYSVNFDAGMYYYNQEIFFEIKSLRKSSKSPLYVFRLDKELKAQKISGNPVIYIFCCHKIQGAKTQADITRMIINGPIDLYLIQLNEVAAMTDPLPLKTISKEKGLNGYNRKGYEKGYKNLPQKQIDKACDFATSITMNIYGSRKTFDVYASRNLNVSLPKKFGVN